MKRNRKSSKQTQRERDLSIIQQFLNNDDNDSSDSDSDSDYDSSDYEDYENRIRKRMNFSDQERISYEDTIRKTLKFRDDQKDIEDLMIQAAIEKSNISKKQEKNQKKRFVTKTLNIGDIGQYDDYYNNSESDDDNEERCDLIRDVLSNDVFIESVLPYFKLEHIFKMTSISKFTSSCIWFLVCRGYWYNKWSLESDIIEGKNYIRGLFRLNILFRDKILLSFIDKNKMTKECTQPHYRNDKQWNIFSMQEFTHILICGYRHITKDDNNYIITILNKICKYYYQLNKKEKEDHEFKTQYKKKGKPVFKSTSFTKLLFKLFRCVFCDESLKNCELTNTYMNKMMKNLKIMDKKEILKIGVAISRRNSRTEIIKHFLQYCFFGSYEKGWIKVGTTNHDLIKSMYLQSISSKAFLVTRLLRYQISRLHYIFNKKTFPALLCEWIITDHHMYKSSMVINAVYEHKFCADLCLKLLEKLDLNKYLNSSVKIDSWNDECSKLALSIHFYIDTDECKFGTTNN